MSGFFATGYITAPQGRPPQVVATTCGGLPCGAVIYPVAKNPLTVATYLGVTSGRLGGGDCVGGVAVAASWW